jgi:2',3'-cyclic-nucleotide 2'-phosphodiesterase (5'-nucleotidase family)
MLSILFILFHLGGHEHTPFYFTHSGTTIIKCGQNMDDLGILDLSFQKNSENNVKAEYSFKLLPTEDTERDETVDAVIRKWTDTISEGAGGGDILCAIGDHCLSTLTSDLRTRETAFACMVADAIVYSYEDLGCQLGIQNGGFVRYGTRTYHFIYLVSLHSVSLHSFTLYTPYHTHTHTLTHTHTHTDKTWYTSLARY